MQSFENITLPLLICHVEPVEITLAHPNGMVFDVPNSPNNETGKSFHQKLATKADPRLTQDIAYIYKILHCNHFIILSKATEYKRTTINWCPSPVVVSRIHPV